MTLRRLVILLLSLFSSPLVWAENTVVEFNPLEKIHGSVAEAVTTANEEAEQAKLEPKYPIEIKADNAEIQTMLENYLPLIAYQRKEVLDKEQVGYLAEDAPTDAKKMIQTEGYFNSEVNVSPQGEGYLVDVKVGKRTKIENVNVFIAGDVMQDSELGTYYKNAFSNWKLPVGSNFRQDDWASSKTGVLSAVSRKKYPLAALTQSQALINPQTQQAELTVGVDSKQPIYFGDFEIEGNQRYPKDVILGMATFQTGDAYDLDKLLDYQQALESDSHYSGASVQVDFDKLQDNRVPIKIAVSEVKRQKFEAGVRFDSEYGLGGNISYDHYNVFNRGYVGSVVWDMDKYQTTLGVGISQPRNNTGHYWTSNVTYNRSTTQKLEKRALSSGLWYVRDRGNIESRLGLEFLAEDNKIPSEGVNLGRSFATMLTASWKRHNLETALRPHNGYYLEGKVGTTLGSLLSSTFMARAKGSAGYYFTPENKAIGTFVARGEIGYVRTKDDFLSGDVPSSLMFRTGGASSIRGYELESIGRKTNLSNAVLPDRAMFAASAEYQYPIKQDFALAVFHDVGNVAHTFKEMQNLYHGTGIGVRWFSPAAPFSFDIAYGHRDKKVRWHISLGTRF
ncbi:autotransporter assembly complex protein TamA [Kingella negevensis]|uniref:Translocation and assembly module TamA n=1 Tax=Kingella negevensis TaxID=1522312 RepID=A0A238T944_9NEIS|nr:autotransporter assembly complex family protein [Kingella negevensis]MDK4683759.1 autotransporter assembly complex protein TamA [Kingella negevensis]MDK4697071.1 autotransporter assembly complex protein TamA [Kingella negevensis]MDK4708259.1 autotransporter assembly complex protein TamA [Kingella negevensis]MDK4709095.1 autotransporter assembly complex protein TamA [Kingella negevensis]SNB51593.1 Translocation and assembly module TamA precursor [Kingella negevensis]